MIELMPYNGISSKKKSIFPVLQIANRMNQFTIPLALQRSRNQHHPHYVTIHLRLFYVVFAHLPFSDLQCSPIGTIQLVPPDQNNWFPYIRLINNIVCTIKIS